MTEQNIEVDENDKRIGVRSRTDFHTGKYIHRSVYLLLFNTNGEILLQQRASDKEWYPDLFTFAVGGTVEDESYEDCIKREMKEEIGVSIDARRLFKYPFFDTYDKAWRCVFVGTTDNKITPDAREIQRTIWISVPDLKKEIVSNPTVFTKPFIEGIGIYFDKFHGKMHK
jgi:isopentenyldiphosphate isomerase